MRFSRAVVVVAAVLLLAACQGHESTSITGGYGNSMLSGVVTMADGMQNSSPAGVRVAVAGTGMSLVLGADGHFSFFGVPESTQLIFSRDDVNATMRVNPSPAPLAIELSPNSAHNGRHHATPSGPQLQVEGTIVTVSNTQLVVQPEHGSKVTFVITTSTQIFQGDKSLTPADLKAGDQVHVKAMVNGTTNTAMSIFLQNPDDGNSGNPGSQTMTANGTVTAVGSGQLTVLTVPNGSVVVQVDSSTIIRMEGSVITLSDIKVGFQVNCLGTRVDDHTLKATQIEVRGVSDHP